MNKKSLVIIMCGLAGSGKTIYSQQLEKNGFVRLSIDEEIWKNYGRYGIDYPPEKYNYYSIKTETKLRDYLKTLILNNKQVVIDFSFWQRETRNEYKKFIEAAGGEWKLIYLKAHLNILRQRLNERNKRFDANAAFPISDDILNSYLKNFEEPFGENEIVIEQYEVS